MDIWNFDFHDSTLVLYVLKGSDYVVNEENLKAQLITIMENLGSEAKEIRVTNATNVKTISAIGNIGKVEFLFEQYGFENANYKFLAFTYILEHLELILLMEGSSSQPN